MIFKSDFDEDPVNSSVMERVVLEFDMSVNLRRYVGVLAKRRFSLIGLGFGLGFEANIRLGEFDFW